MGSINCSQRPVGKTVSISFQNAEGPSIGYILECLATKKLGAWRPQNSQSKNFSISVFRQLLKYLTCPQGFNIFLRKYNAYFKYKKEMTV